MFPGDNSCFADTIFRMRQQVVQRIIHLVWVRPQKALLLQLLVREDAQLMLDQTAQLKLIEEIAAATPKVLRGKLESDDPLVRLIAIQAIASRRLPLETDLIERLNDREPAIRQAARRALIRLTRGTDFGPTPSMGKARRLRAMDKWRHWLALQKPAAPSPDVAMRVVLERADPAAAEDAEVARLSDELVKARGDKQAEVLQRLKMTRGGLHTDALALAIPRLPEPMRTKARVALAERLTRMTAKTLRERLADEDAEVRRATATACALKKVRDHVPDLIPLLLDAEAAVAEAAHHALVDLTRQDFGPKPGAPAAARARAVAAWKDWWRKHRDRAE